MKAVQYGDTVVYVEDLKSLGKHQWLGDRVISFYFEFLQNEVYPEYPAICFVSPVVVQLIGSLTVPTEVEQFVSAMCLDERDLILLPLNNNIDYSMAAGGSHWSLLVFDRREHVFTHYDSMRHNNWKPAVDLVNKLHPSLDRYAEIIKATCPQQRNGSDCGMYAMVFAAEVAQAFADNRKPDLDCATPSFVDAKRKNLYDLIIQIGKPCDNIR
ncbi:hypothetical protein SARC_02245 [Sphaeroforma arctica JP610]|uniref:Ubiquitin-like protease family profile domain-containing protein n=1 Tax=Sphaeroforma arctica JP610 TaxID=667725 RepID=A0A0L0GBH8_9EUKA|nr:hypothetical protein SARC_02245 [Sphaeroforma arctica JP610]KNC85588.1 hypothetical protein SARC_02245 [Sphaeroforma arctica JP610]|eukprot:XP_014159490.1 hypothetical protein SARC_02245 [Sphaeroforma arctica JP610]